MSYLSKKFDTGSLTDLMVLSFLYFINIYYVLTICQISGKWWAINKTNKTNKNKKRQARF